MRVLLLCATALVVTAVQRSKAQSQITQKCQPEMVGDGKCDIQCAYENHDGGDCTRDTVCALWAGDHWCDSLCFDEEHNWDSGDCSACPEGWNGDGFCDIGCNTGDDHDGGDCGECPQDWIGDDFCDSECMTDAYSYDNGDCYFEFKI